MAMGDYLSNETPDLTDTIDLPLKSILSIQGGIYQEVDTYPGNKQEVYDFGNDSDFTVRFSLAFLTSVQAAGIFNICFNPAKAVKMLKTFLWAHPTDGYTYVVRFASKVTREIFDHSYQGIKTITMKVSGTYGA